MAEIARAYGCTPPAIRYILSRTESGEARRDDVEIRVAPTRRADGRPGAEVVSVEPRVPVSRPSAGELWDRVASDVASFLAGMDAVSENDSAENYEALLLATDRLLRSSARTRMEVERMLASRRSGNRKRG